jgi:hypothetical protein
MSRWHYVGHRPGPLITEKHGVSYYDDLDREGPGGRPALMLPGRSLIGHPHRSARQRP